MPAWSNWVTFILATATALVALAGGAIAAHRKRRRLKLSFSVQPYAPGGTSIGDGPPRPRELLQLDIANTSVGPIVLTGVRMRLRGERTERPVFDEALGESWILRKEIAPGASVFVKCSGSNEALLDRIRTVVVYANAGKPVRIGGGAARRAARMLRKARGR